MSGLDPGQLAKADQEFAEYMTGIAGLVEVTREMLADIGPIPTVVALGSVLYGRAQTCPLEVRKTSFMLATALIQLAQMPAGES